MSYPSSAVEIEHFMKREIMVAIALAFICGGISVAGTKCWKCNGTGWDGRFKCSTCGGDEEIG